MNKYAVDKKNDKFEKEAIKIAEKKNVPIEEARKKVSKKEQEK